MNRHRIFGLGFVFLACFISACSGGGGGGSSTALPSAATAGTGSGIAATTGSTATGTKTVQIQVLLDAPMTTSSKARSPQYINVSADEVFVGTYDGSNTTSQVISLGSPAPYSPSFIATSTTPCELFHSSSPRVRSCTLQVSVSPGTLTFYVFPLCGYGCNSDEAPDGSQAFVLGAGVASATIPGTSTISVPISPLIVSSATTLAVATPLPSNIQLAGCSLPCVEAVIFDGNDPTASTPLSLGALSLTAFDGFGAIPAVKTDPIFSDWTAGFTTGTGYNGTPPTVANTDNFIVATPAPPATSVSAVPITVGAFQTYAPSNVQHVTIGGSSACTTSFTTTLSNASVLAAAAPYVCYDNAAPFNGDATQYYSDVSAVGGNPIVPCGGSYPTCPPILTQLYYVPMFVNLDTSPVTDCDISSFTACIQIGEFGTNSSYSVQATIAAGNATASPSPGCDSGYTLQGLTIAGTTYIGGSPSATASPVSGNGSGGTVSSPVDKNGYAEIALTAPANGTCTIAFAYFSGGLQTGPTLTRTYSTSGGSGTLTTVFGRTRRPASSRR